MNAKDCISRISDLTGRLEMLKQAAVNASGSGADIDQGIDAVLHDLLELQKSFDGEVVASGDIEDQRDEVLSHKRIFSLLNVLPGLVFLVDKDYRIRFANHTFLDSFTDPREMHCFEVMLARDGVCEGCELEKVFAEHEPHSWQFDTSDGRHFKIFAYPFSDVDNTPMALLLGVDLTEQTRAAEALARSEHWLRTIMDNSFDGISMCRWDKATDSRVLVTCNERYVEMSGRSLDELKNCDNLDKFVTICEEKKIGKDSAGRVDRGLSSWNRPDGKENYFEWVDRIAKIDGETYFIGIDRDVTERRRNDRALKESEKSERAFRQQLEALHRLSRELSSAQSETELYRKVVELGCERLGFDRMSIWLKTNDDPPTFRGTFGIDEQGQLRDESDSELAGGLHNFDSLSGPETLWVSQQASLKDDERTEVGSGASAVAGLWDGQTVFGYVTVDNLLTHRPITDQQAELLKALSADVGHLHGRLRAEETLREREKWVSLVMEHSTDGINICSIDPETSRRKLVMCNDQYVEMSGHTREQLMDAEDLDALINVIEPTSEFLSNMLTGSPDKGVDSWNRPDGKENCHEWTAAPLEIDGVLHIIGIDRDITNRLRNERAIKQSEESERAFRKQLQVLHEVILKLAKARSVDELCRKAVELGHGRLGFDGISIYFPSEENPQKYIGTWGIDTNGDLWDIKDLWFDNEPGGIFDLVAKGQQQEWLIDDADHGPGAPWGVEGPYMRAGAALWDSQKAFGLLTINNWNRLEPITQRQVEIVRLLAAELGHLIARQRAEDELHASEKSERAFRQQLQELHEVVIDLGKAKSVDELCRLTVEYGHNRLGFDGISVHFCDKDDPLRFTGTYSIDINGELWDIRDRGFSVEPDGLAMKVIEGKATEWLTVDDEPPTGPWARPGMSTELGTYMRAGAAMWDGSKVFGVLTLNNWNTAEPITRQQIEIVRLLAAEVGHLIVRQRAEDELHASEESERAFRKQLQILHEVSIELAKCDSTKELCRRAVELSCEKLGFDRMGIWFKISDNPVLFRGSFGIDEDGNLRDESGSEIEAAGRWAEIMSNRPSVWIDDDAAIKDDHAQDVGTGCAAAAPLWQGEDLLGFVSVDNLLTHQPITQQQTEVLKALSADIGHLCGRLRAEEALQESERQLRSIMDNSFDGISMCRWDKATDSRVLVTCNERYVEMSGRTLEELKNCGDLDKLVTPLHQEKSQGIRNRSVGSGLSSWNRPDGKENYFEWVDRAAKMDGGTYFIGIDRDVTERMRSEKDMRIKDIAIDAAVSPITIVSLDRIVDYVNQSFLDLWGYDDASQVIGLSVDEFYTIRTRRDEVKQIVLDTGHWSGEVEGIRKDGTNFDAHVAISLVSDKNGEPLCGMMSFLDITERKEFEKQVTEVGILERQKIGHDLHDSLGQILTGVGFLATSLQDKLDKKSLPEAADAARIADAINESIHQARSLARGLQPVRLEAGGLMDALREFADDTSRLFSISCVFQCKKQVLIADNVTAAHVYHIAQEAVSNAFRHGKAGNIIIDLGIDVDEVTLRITDDGKGMPQDITDSKGLGMRTMNYRAGMIGGVLEIQSDRREGTSVICRFPAP